MLSEAHMKHLSHPLAKTKCLRPAAHSHNKKCHHGSLSLLVVCEVVSVRVSVWVGVDDRAL